MALETERGKSEEIFLSSDLVYEVLRRVDALTLAKASCVSSEFRSVCEDEGVWESRCNSRWPSTRDPSVRKIVTSAGGFKRFYANSYPCISGKGVAKEESLGKRNLRLLCSQKKPEVEEISPSDFISIIDVVYNGESVLSKCLEGIPGAEDFLGWFINCPFRIDLLESPDEIDGYRKDEEGITAVTIQTDVPADLSMETERREGKLWKEICDNMRVSWVLINKKTGRTANLASWKPLGGLRHWPSDEDFILRFGTILPAARSLPNGAVYCNIVVRARVFNTDTAEDCKATLGITELSMQLENTEGARLYGAESLQTLSRASSCEKTSAHAVVLDSYHEFLQRRSVRKEEKIRHESRRETAAALISGFGAFLCLCYVLS